MGNGSGGESPTKVGTRSTGGATRGSTRSVAVLTVPRALRGAVGALVGRFGPQIRSTDSEIAGLERVWVAVAGHRGRTLSVLSANSDDLPRVVYIHGTPGDALAWCDYLTDPVAGLRALAVDRLGFGRSVSGLSASGRPVCAAVTSYAEQAEAIAGLLEARGGRWPIVVGHSLGAPIAAQVAAQYPDRVGGLVVVSGSFDPGYEKPAWFNRLTGAWPVSSVMPGSIRVANAEIFAGERETSRLSALLGQIRCPSVIIHGERDRLVPVANAEFVRARLTGAASVETVIVPGVGHGVPWEAAGVVREAVGRLGGG